MKPLKNKVTKNLIIIFAITVIFSGLLPNYVQAANTNSGGGLLAPIEKFCVFICDEVMEWLQNTFTSPDSIEQPDGTYEFKYSPGIIFSGTVAAFDINFIKPGEDKDFLIPNDELIGVDNSNLRSYIENNIDEILKSNTRKQVDSEVYKNNLNDLEKRGHKNTPVSGKTNYTSGGYSQLHYDIYYYIEENSTNDNKDDVLVIELFGRYGVLDDTGHHYYDKIPIEFYIIPVANQSTASKLQSTLATWYIALRRIALVGLLSVLVYVGIRIVISSAAADKAKYKEMLKDWLVAICLLFTLHYIMSITITVTNEISKIFSAGEVDKILGTLRNEILSGNSWGEVLAKVIMYVFLVMQTVVFTVRYLIRVIYMAFYTLIAPLITLTYPLDKIKDGQAQAFNMWFKEYIFTALIQVVHLVIYFVLVSSAIELVEHYPLYALIVISFMKKAEDLVKKMFGLDNSETVGTIGQAMTGGLIMNAINKLGSSTAPKPVAAGAPSTPRTTPPGPTPPGPTPPGPTPPGPTPPGPTPPGPTPTNPLTRILGSGGAGKVIKGATTMAGRFVSTGANIFGMGVGAIAGTAASLLDGDLKDLIPNILAGASTGKNLVNWIPNKAEQIPEAIKGNALFKQLVINKLGITSDDYDKMSLKDILDLLIP